jgi:hypothetical protein
MCIKDYKTEIGQGPVRAVELLGKKCSVIRLDRIKQYNIQELTA